MLTIKIVSAFISPGVYAASPHTKYSRIPDTESLIQETGGATYPSSLQPPFNQFEIAIEGHSPFVDPHSYYDFGSGTAGGFSAQILKQKNPTHNFVNRFSNGKRLSKIGSTRTFRGYSRYGVAGKGRKNRTFSRRIVKPASFISSYQKIEKPVMMTEENWEKWLELRIKKMHN